MKIPDKIYLAKSDNVKGEILSNFAGSTPFKRHDSIAYIRKDALLEWANRLKEKWEEPPLSRYSPGCSFMLGQVIKKIESL